MILPANTLESARQWDAQDPLNGFREQFLIPTVKQTPIIYLTGNSLGLQPRDAGAAVEREMEDWARFGVEGHFHARHPWFSYHERFTAGEAS
ncbi:MAG: kynureninase, partial [Bacteroidetes bacterium]|nr:kynureninase [Bacteroidota bacterium]